MQNEGTLIISLVMRKPILAAFIIASAFTVQLYALTCKSNERHCEYEDPYKIVEWCCPSSCQCQYWMGTAQCVNCGT